MTHPTRREEYSEATRRALLDSAARLGVEQGFVSTSLEEIATDARVTKGAVYHHFTSKQALFEAVADEAAAEACAAIAAAAAAAPTAWAGAVAGLDCFVERCLDARYRRLCFQEGPAVMGFERWWEHGERRELGMLRSLLERLRAEGSIEMDDLESTAQLLFGSLTAMALAVTRSDDPRAEAARVRAALIQLVGGLRRARATPEPTG